MARTEIPDIVIGRLPIYLRELQRLQQQNIPITSSQGLGERLGISSAQIRKDLSHFGEFGKQGTGYNVASLIAELVRILNVDREWAVALIGVGDLGRAIAHYQGFAHRGFVITQLFDSDPSKIGQMVGNMEIFPTDQLKDKIEEAGIKVAMIATPAEVAQEVADSLVKAGVRAILNYAPIVLNTPENVHVQYINPVLRLQQMAYYLNK